MRALLCLSALFLVACPPSRGDDDDSADCAAGDDGTLRVCATYGDEPASGSATVRPLLGEPETDAILGADGCVELALAPGDWEWRAAAANDTCVSVYSPATVESCETTTVSVELIEWCMDGR